MASISKPGLALALIVIIVVSSSSYTVTTVDARSPYNRVRKLATDCDSPIQGEIPGCGGGGGSGGSSRPRPRPRPSGPTPGASRCRKGCCGRNKLGDCVCCE
ncbi:uncharacterized protein LOC112503632 [Cynara cardunculus var. scolymus]|uniref:Uncharacterized protein n=1 Tax=Cynara cardunculus var. scolymus TaxID=59895 RepID=A0A118JS55_CYNCS|nr:uncharacterized protein LOC112503632 [Cynara cardunculus var. scolymus]KVH87432.1 hypothetical protein Ccrd_025330 [Cynara cardunculus var. scolymus]